MRHRGDVALGCGVVAAAVGVVAAVAGEPALAPVSGAAGLLAGGLAFDAQRSRAARDRDDGETVAGVAAMPSSVAALVDRDFDPAIRDPATGLFTAAYFQATVDARVATARRVLRPLSIILLDVARRGDDETFTPAVDQPMIDAVAATLREADTACGLGARLGIILEDTPEDGAVWTAERLRRAVATERGDIVVWAGVASYPTHGLTAAELVVSAEAALDLAREWRQDRIEVADS